MLENNDFFTRIKCSPQNQESFISDIDKFLTKTYGKWRAYAQKPDKRTAHIENSDMVRSVEESLSDIDKFLTKTYGEWRAYAKKPDKKTAHLEDRSM